MIVRGLRRIVVVIIIMSLPPTYGPPNAGYYEKTKDGTNDSQRNGQTLIGGVFSEGVLEFGVDVEEGREEAEEVDDDVSFASRTVYLQNNLKFAKDLEKKKCIHQGIQDGKSLTGRY